MHNIPNQLYPAPCGHTPKRITPEDVLNVKSDRFYVRADGDCLEGMDVEDGGLVLIDKTKFPKPPRFKGKGGDGSSDICLCYYRWPSSGSAVGLKRYYGVWGHLQMVSTCYKAVDDGPARMNALLDAMQIFGVAIASYGRDGKLLWKRDPNEFADSLGNAPTIGGDVVPI